MSCMFNELKARMIESTPTAASDFRLTHHTRANWAAAADINKYISFC